MILIIIINVSFLLRFLFAFLPANPVGSGLITSMDNIAGKHSHKSLANVENK